MESSPDEIFRQAMTSFQAGRLSDAERGFRDVLKRQPQHLGALNLLGILLITTQKFAEAEQQLKQALKLNTKSDATLSNYGIVLKALRRPSEALKSFDQALAINPNIAGTWNSRGAVLNDLKRYVDAIVDFDKAISLQANYAEAFCNKGNSFSELLRYEQALEAYGEALNLKPNFPEALAGRGNVLCRLRRYDEAMNAFDKAASLNPGLPESWLGRGNVLFEFGRHEEALAAYERALALKPDFAQAWLGRGNVYHALLRQPEDILVAYDKALALNPDLAEAWLGRGNVYSGLKRVEEAFAAFDWAFKIKPDLTPVEGNRLHAKMLLCDWCDFEAERDRLIESVRSGNENAGVFQFLSVSDSPADQLACARLCVRNHFPARALHVAAGARYDHDRIRIGYLSADFRDHPSGHSLINLFECHDHARFEVIGLSIGPNDSSKFRERILKAFDYVHEIRLKTDLEAAQLIKQLEVDVLVAIAPHAEYSRLGILAHRPAPVQVNYTTWTSGADYIDYIIADPHAAPFDEQRHFSEQIVHISGFANDPTENITSSEFRRSDHGLPEDAFVFCGFNAYYKFNPQTFDVWMRLLKRVDKSVLWLSRGNPTAIANLRREAEAREVDPSRLVVAPGMPSMSDHLARHRLADLFLDTLPFGAQTTARDALWAGLPVLTCRGKTYAGRVATAQLHAIGLSELVTSSFDEYEATAMRLAQNPAELAALRDRLAANRLTHPLFDMKALCREFEAAYVTMLERQRRGEPPQHFAAG